MVDNKLVGVGVTAACASLLLLYLYKLSTKKETPKKSNVKKLMSRYRAEASGDSEDVQASGEPPETSEAIKPPEASEASKPPEGSYKPASEGYKPGVYDGLKTDSPDLARAASVSPDLARAASVSPDLARAVSVSPDLARAVSVEDMPSLVPVEIGKVQQTESQQSPQQSSSPHHEKHDAAEQHGPSTEEARQCPIASMVAEQHIAGGTPDRGELVRAVVHAEDVIK